MTCLLIAGVLVYGLCKLIMWSFEPLYYTYTKTSTSCDGCIHCTECSDGNLYCTFHEHFVDTDSCDNHTVIIPKEKINDML